MPADYRQGGRGAGVRQEEPAGDGHRLGEGVVLNEGESNKPGDGGGLTAKR